MAACRYSRSTQRVGKAAARQSDLAEHRRQHDPHPDRLLAVLGALQRLGAGDSVRLPAACCASAVISSAGKPQIADAQVGILRLAVVAAEEIGLENLVADAVSVEKGAVVQPLGHQRVRDTEHQRHIRARADRVPDCLDLAPADRRAAGRSGEIPRRGCRAARSRASAMCSPVPPPPTSLFFSAMPPKASTRALSATSSSQLTLLPATIFLRADDVRQDHRCGARAVAADRADIAAGYD